MVISYRIKLLPTDSQIKHLEKLISKQKKAVNIFLETKTYNLVDLFPVYKKIKESTEISANLLAEAEMVAIRIGRKNNRSIYKANRLFIRGNLISIHDGHIVFGIGEKIQYIKNPHFNIEGKIKESSIASHKDVWFANISVEKQELPVKKYKKYIGVDLGIIRTAVVATDKKPIKIFNGKQNQFIKNKYHEKRRELQPKLKQGNIYRFLKQQSGKESYWIKDKNHKIAKEIVNIASKMKCGIAMERLTGITERLKFNTKTNRMIKGWSFSQLSSFVSYKAKLKRIPVIFVDPRGTSSTCPKCKNMDRKNRSKQALFKCIKCGYQNNADIVGAMNIASRAITVS